MGFLSRYKVRSFAILANGMTSVIWLAWSFSSVTFLSQSESLRQFAPHCLGPHPTISRADEHNGK
jgi:hypothetical protein